MTDHTPLPWTGFSDSGMLVAIMPAGREGDICTFEKSPNNPDANFMMAAINNHEALVEMLKEASLQIEYLQEKVSTSTGVAVLARINHLLAAVGTVVTQGK